MGNNGKQFTLWVLLKPDVMYHPVRGKSFMKPGITFKDTLGAVEAFIFVGSPLSWQVNTDKEDILFFTTKLKGLKGHSALYVACMHILEQKCQLVEPVVELDSAR